MARLLCVYGARMVYDAGMVTNFVGVQRDFTVVAGTSADVGIRVIDADGADVNVGVCTWKLGVWRDGAEPVAEKFGELLPNPAGARVSDLFWRFPELAAGLWRYELVATDSEGEAARVFYGVIGSREASDIVAGSPVIGVKGWRMLEAQLPVEAGGKLQARWLAGEYVLALCEVARGHAVNAESSAAAAADSADAAAASAERAAGIASGMQGALDNAVGMVTQRAEAAAERAEDAAADAEAAKNEATAKRDEVFEKFEETDEFIEAFWRDASSVIVPNSATGTWYVGGKDTSSPYRGANGKSPRVTPDGYWETWEWAGDAWDSGSWVSTGTLAEGKNGFSPYINAAGYWVYIDPVSGRQVTGDMAGGRDGIDGVTVRRVLVDSYEDIPQSGETCNGGYYYYVRGWKQEVTAKRVLVFVKRWDSMLGGGVRMTATNGESSAFSLRDNTEATCRDINSGYSLVSASVVDDQTIELVSLSGEDLQFESYVADALGLMEYEDFEEGRGYDVYAWLETDGVGSWVCVGLANDLATAEVYGLMKYGTDKVVSYGAPVGQNHKGQATVPVADTSLPGAVKPTTLIDPLKGNPDSGGGTHMGSNGKLYADVATPKLYGAMMHSYGSSITDSPGCVGVRADGKTDVVWATLNQGGAVRLGSYIEQVTNRPYILSVGAINAPDRPDDKHKLANNLMVGGALKHATKGEWTSWCPHVQLSGLASEGYYLGLHISKSFNQSEGEGLTLNPATDRLLGGVKIQETLASASNVPTGEAVLNYLQEQYYTKAETYTQAETDARIRAIVPDVISGVLASYATQSWSRNNFVSKSDYDAWKERVTEMFVSDGNLINANTQAINANKKNCDAAIVSLISTVNANKTACDNSVSALNSRVSAMESAGNKYVGRGNSGIEEIWLGTSEEFSKVTISGAKWYLILEN